RRLQAAASTRASQAARAPGIAVMTGTSYRGRMTAIGSGTGTARKVAPRSLAGIAGMDKARPATAGTRIAGTGIPTPALSTGTSRPTASPAGPSGTIITIGSSNSPAARLPAARAASPATSSQATPALRRNGNAPPPGTRAERTITIGSATVSAAQTPQPIRAG